MCSDYKKSELVLYNKSHRNTISGIYCFILLSSEKIVLVVA